MYSPEELAADVATHGWIVMKVSNDMEPDFACSIGLYSSFEHAELLMFGLDPETRAGPVVLEESKLLGCYALFDYADRPASERLEFAPAFTKLEAGGSALALKVDTSIYRIPFNRKWRLNARSDSVHISFLNTGFSGTEFVFGLAANSDTLRGRAIGRNDLAPTSVNLGIAKAIRVPCHAIPS